MKRRDFGIGSMLTVAACSANTVDLVTPAINLPNPFLVDTSKQSSDQISVLGGPFEGPYPYAIFIINLRTQEITPIVSLETPFANEDIVWSSDARQLAFAKRDGRRTWSTDIYLSHVDDEGKHATEPTKLIKEEDSLGRDFPQWSPTGSKILFNEQKEPDNPFYPNLILVDPDGSNRLQVLPSYSMSRDYLSSSAAWSPDGRKIAFLGGRDLYEWQIYIFDIESKDTIQLTNNPGMITPFDWSPTGNHIIYLHRKDAYSKEYAIRLISLDGNDTELFKIKGSHEYSGIYSIYWSPDGANIVFVEQSNGWVDKIHRIRMDTVEPELQIIVPVSELDGTQGRMIQQFLEWAPDGKSFLYWLTGCLSGGRGDCNRIISVDQEGKREAVINRQGIRDSYAHPKWRPPLQRMARMHSRRQFLKFA